VNAIDKGADLTGFVDTDRDGASRPVDGDSAGGAAWDIGPYEYNAGSGTVRIWGAGSGLAGFHIYPNPVSKNADIKISLQNANIKFQKLKFDIFNVNGGRIFSKVLFSAYDISWNASNVASGTYFILLNSDNRTVAAQKIIVKR
jgi:hypothetical protein